MSLAKSLVKSETLSVPIFRKFLLLSLKTHIFGIKQKIEMYKSSEVEPLSIKFENFNFSYKTKSEEKVLKNISFNIHENDRITLRGKSGAGKTTICKILTELYPTDVENLEKSIISFSSQHPLMLSSASIIENVDPYSIL